MAEILTETLTCTKTALASGEPSTFTVTISNAGGADHTITPDPYATVSAPCLLELLTPIPPNGVFTVPAGGTLALTFRGVFFATVPSPFVSVQTTAINVGCIIYAPAYSAWVASTKYQVGDHVTNSSNDYVCTQAGTSAGSGGPTGTTTGIQDNSCIWDYVTATCATPVTKPTEVTVTVTPAVEPPIPPISSGQLNFTSNLNSGLLFRIGL